MKVLDLFSGIGGFSLGLERAGFETVAFCEIEPYCQKVLKKHWPDIPIYEDVRNVTRERLEADGIIPDVITGGFPCQDISVAGKQAGIEGERSGLWSECARILGEFRPRYAIFENVTALLSGERGKWFERVLWDISEVGYDAEWHCIPASAIGANHHRDRVWVICYPSKSSESISPINDEAFELPDAGPYTSSLRVCDMPGSRCLSDKKQHTAEAKQGRHKFKTGSSTNGKRRAMADPNSIDVERSSHTGGARIVWPGMVEQSARCNTDSGGVWFAEPGVGRVANGIPRRVDRLKGLGNAVVPQIPEIIGRAILEHENNH